jgi:CRP/FNR family transcriptional regulator, cyclic AMP receptor protein
MVAVPTNDWTEAAEERRKPELYIQENGSAFISRAAGMGGGSTARASFLSQVVLFASLGERDRRAVMAACQDRTFKPGEVLFHEGDLGHALYILHSGRVKIVVVAPDGKETILHIYRPGQCFGELALLDGGPRSATVVALDRVEVLALYQEDFLALLERCPGMALAMIRRLTEMVRRLSKQVQDLASLDITARIAKKLLELADQHGEPTPHGICIALQLTQQDLAEMIGAARGRVNMCLSGFQERGILTIERERITLHKPEELRKRIY